MTARLLSRLQRLSLVLTGFLSACLVLCPSQVAASTDYFDLDPEQLLGAEVLSASRRGESVAKTSAAVYVVTGEDIMRSGATNIPDALRMVPGVHIAQSDSNSWAISIRGFSSTLANKLLVMIDGRTIYNPLFGGVFWEAHDLVMEDIERIEVIRGPGGALWGANAVNGIINIITKHSRKTTGNMASALYGNEERGTLSFRHGGSFSDSETYRLYAKAFERDTAHSAGNFGDPYDKWSGYRAGFRLDDGDEFTLQGDVYHNETDQKRVDFMLVAPFAIIQEQTIKYQGANLLGRWNRQGDNGALLTVQSYLDWARRDEPFNFTDDRGVFDIDLQYNLAPRGRHELIVGGAFRFIQDHEKADTDILFISETRSDTLYSAFIQDKITLISDELYLTLGSKIEHNEYSGLEVQPNIRVQWHPDEDKTIWGAVSRAVKTPTRIEHDVTATFGAGSGVKAALVGNPGFDSEELTAFELGYRDQVTPDISLDTTVFYNAYSRLATLELAGPPFPLINNGVDPIHLLIPLEFRNNMEGKTYGFEAAASWSANESLKLTASYSLLRLSVDAPHDPTQEDEEDLFPAHQAGLRASWNVNDRLTFDMAAYYVDRLKIPETDDYVRLDMNLGWQVNEAIRFNLVGQNLVDRAHREFGAANGLNAAEIERSIFGKITWNF